MKPENKIITLRNIGIAGGILNAVSLGFINSVYSTRFPSSSGARFLLDVFIVGLSNPYALLSGVLVFLIFNRLDSNISKQCNAIDAVFLILAAMAFILEYSLMGGVIVY